MQPTLCADVQNAAVRPMDGLRPLRPCRTTCGGPAVGRCTAPRHGLNGRPSDCGDGKSSHTCTARNSGTGTGTGCFPSILGGGGTHFGGQVWPMRWFVTLGQKEPISAYAETESSFGPPATRPAADPAGRVRLRGGGRGAGGAPHDVPDARLCGGDEGGRQRLDPPTGGTEIWVSEGGRGLKWKAGRTPPPPCWLGRSTTSTPDPPALLLG